jgi:hypothetical protein
MKVLSLAALALLAGCSSTQSALAPGATPSQTVVNSPGTLGSVTISRNDAIVSATLAAPPATVWPLVAQAFTDIGIPVDQVDQSARAASATNQRVRRLAGKGLASYFNCAGPFGNAANRDDVFLTLRTQVVPGQGDGSTLRISASAVARSSTSANTVTDCSSNGELEKLITQKVTERLGGAAGNG